MPYGANCPKLKSRLHSVFFRFLIGADERSTDVAKLVGLKGEGGNDLIGNVEKSVSHAAKFFTTGHAHDASLINGSPWTLEWSRRLRGVES